MDKNTRRFSLSFKLNILIIAIILAVSIGLVFISYRTYSSKIDSLYYAKVETLAHSVSVNYTENLILPLISMAQSEEFQEVREQAENTNDHELLEQWMMKHKVKEFYTSELEFAGVDAEEEAISRLIICLSAGAATCHMWRKLTMFLPYLFSTISMA